MKKFEYRDYSIRKDSFEKVLQELNKLGEDGWELVYMNKYNSVMGWRFEYDVILKREKNE